MITIISGTNRKDARTHLVAKAYATVLQGLTDEAVQYVSLEYLQNDLLHEGMFQADAMKPALQKVQDECIIPAEKLIFVAPEYNGGFPGILKLFIDALSIRAYKSNFSGKKALLVGVASGRGGNLRGLEDLTGILNYLGTTVFPNKVPYSLIEQSIEENELGATIKEAIEAHAKAFLAY